MRPWDRPRPTGAVDVATDDDDWVTVDKWPREVFRAHYHDADFNWIVPMRAGRVVIAVEQREITIDGDRWICVFPRVAHAVVHVSDDCEVLSLFVPSTVMAAAWDKLAVKPELAQHIVGGESTVAHGLALAWGEQRFARRRRDPFDDALALFVAGWLWRHCGAPAVGDDLAVHLRSALGADGATVAAFFERHLADQPFPWPALATALGTSTRTLQRRFVDAVGASPSAMLQRFRLDRARDLLRDPSRPVGDIAIAAGFSSQAHFATAFRAAFGQSPTAFRRGRD